MEGPTTLWGFENTQLSISFTVYYGDTFIECNKQNPLNKILSSYLHILIYLPSSVLFVLKVSCMKFKISQFTDLTSKHDGDSKHRTIHFLVGILAYKWMY